MSEVNLAYQITTPLTEVHPDDIRVVQVGANVITHYQRQMSKAVWRPAPGRKLGFLVVQGNSLLGLLFLASPVIRLSVRDAYLGITRDFGTAMRNYMDLSVCVAAQPIGWHWNLGKLMALIAPTLGDYIEARYPDTFKGVTTTSLWGRGTQYNRIYKYLGTTKGFGHEHVSDAEYKKMVAYLKSRVIFGGTLPSCSFRAGSNPRMRRIAEYRRVTCDPNVTLKHGTREASTTTRQCRLTTDAESFGSGSKGGVCRDTNGRRPSSPRTWMDYRDRPRAQPRAQLSVVADREVRPLSTLCS